MTDLASLCPGCFAKKPEGPVCPLCGYDEERERLPPLCLPRRTVLHGEYMVGKPLGRPGGFGITYLAWYSALELRVAIKEYLPRALAGRRNGSLAVESHSPEDEVDFRYGIEQFREEARTLARLDHPNIMRVRSLFEENGTAYLVMDYHEGQSLPQLLAARGGRLPEDEAVALLLPILEALGYIHTQGFLHRDVKPSNLYLKSDGTPILLDFGAARSALGERTMTLSVLLSPGYAPAEQYSAKGQQGPWTDVYAAAATLYHLVTGEKPPDASGRMEDDNLVSPDHRVPGLSPRLCASLLAGLAPRRQGRPQTAWAFRDLLTAPEFAPVEAAPESPTLVSPPPIATASRPAAAPQRPGLWRRSVNRFKLKWLLWRVRNWEEITYRQFRSLLAFLLILGSVSAGLIIYKKFLQPELQKPKPAQEMQSAPPPSLIPAPPKPGTTFVPSTATPILSAPAASKACVPGEEQRSKDDIVFVRICPGTFTMGSAASDTQADTDERPEHQVTLSEFWIGKTEITNEQYRRFRPRHQGEASLPVTGVSWTEAQAACERFDGRLPTEAEWEYAARAGSQAAWSFGDDAKLLGEYAWYGENSSGRPHTVRTKKANPWGIHDIYGNVWEWVADWYGTYPSAAQTDPSGPTTGTNRVLRGGSFFSAWNLRSAGRLGDEPEDRGGGVGFRCARGPRRQP